MSARFKIFEKAGIFILCFFIAGCNGRSKTKVREVNPIDSNIHLSEYQNSDLLFDKNDEKLMVMDTILSFSNNKLLFTVHLKKNKIKLEIKRWNEMPDNKPPIIEEGFQRNGFIYTKSQSNNFEVTYKLILNKGLLQWNGQNWILFKVGDS